jgi:hypothetical protein
MAGHVARAHDRCDDKAIGSQPAIRSETKEPFMTNRTAATAAIILAIAAAGAPTASARPADFVPAGRQAPSSVYSRPDKSMFPVATPYGGDSANAIAPAAVVRVQTVGKGFDWGDAGIGAAGGLALAMLGVGGGLVISHHRPRRTRHTTALPS